MKDKDKEKSERERKLNKLKHERVSKLKKDKEASQNECKIIKENKISFIENANSTLNTSNDKIDLHKEKELIDISIKDKDNKDKKENINKDVASVANKNNHDHLKDNNHKINLKHSDSKDNNLIDYKSD